MGLSTSKVTCNKTKTNLHSTIQMDLTDRYAKKSLKRGKTGIRFPEKVGWPTKRNRSIYLSYADPGMPKIKKSDFKAT